MPTNSMNKSSMPGISRLGQDRLWETAVRQARREGKERDYDHVLKLYRKMSGWKSMEGGDLEKASYLHPSQVFNHVRVPGQVPDRDRLDAIKLAQTPPKPFSVARLLAQKSPVPTPASIVKNLGFDVATMEEWVGFLERTISNSINEIVLRQDIMAKCLNEKLEGALRTTILDRAMKHWREYRKAMIEIVTPDQLLQKAEQEETSDAFMIPMEGDDLEKAAGHKYLSRKKDKRGNWVYEYPVDKKNRIVDMILDWLTKPTNKLTVGTTARSFRIDKQFAGQVLRELESKGKIRKDGEQYVGGGAQKKKDGPGRLFSKPELSARAGKGVETYHMGDKIRFTGKVDPMAGGTFYEFEYLDGHKKGKKGHTQRKPNDLDASRGAAHSKPKIKTPQVPPPKFVIPKSKAQMVPGEQMSLFDRPVVPAPKILPVGASEHVGEDVPKVVEHKQAAEHEADTKAKPAIEKDPTPPKMTIPKAETVAPKKTGESKSRKVLAVEQGEHVYGSKADMFAAVNNASDLGKLKPEDQAKFATKKNLLPKTSVDDHLDTGKTPGYILLRNAIESTVQAKAGNNQQSRENYMDGTTFVQKSLDAIKDEQGVHDFVGDFHYLAQGFRRKATFTEAEVEKMVDDEMTKEGNPPKHDWKTRAQWRREHSSLVDEYNKGVRAKVQDRDNLYVLGEKIRLLKRRIMATDTWDRYKAVTSSMGTPSRDVALKYGGDGSVHVYVADPDIPDSRMDNKYHQMAEALGKRFSNLIKNSNAKYNGPKAYKDASKAVAVWESDNVSAEDQETQLRQALEPKKKAGKKGPRRFKWEREVPGEIQRTGGELVAKADPRALAAEFGFTNVQFGNWVTESDAESHIKGAHGALKDLSDIMGIDRDTISLNGRLALAFGARGSGTASAHYEGASQIINLTKMAGGGSLAHEWAHAMDNIITVSHNPGSTKAGSMISDGDDAGIPSDVAAAYKDVMGTILYQEGYDPDTAQKYHDYLYRESQGKKLGRGDKYMKNRYKRMLDNEQSNYYKSSLEQGGGGRKSYWVRHHELFARAFESHIEDELVGNGRESSYLVSGTRHGGPYPAGEERKRINAAMKKLIGAVRDTKSLEKSLQKLYIVL